MQQQGNVTARLGGIKVAANKSMKMDRAARAKQFMPFAALKGLPEALAKKEKIVVPRPLLSEERMEELDYKMHQLQCGMIVGVTYYEKEECIKKTGMVAKISADTRILQIVDCKISFDAILDIEAEKKRAINSASDN